MGLILPASFSLWRSFDNQRFTDFSSPHGPYVIRDGSGNYEARPNALTASGLLFYLILPVQKQESWNEIARVKREHNRWLSWNCFRSEAGNSSKAGVLLREKSQQRSRSCWR
jgi:hypothetical protein